MRVCAIVLSYKRPQNIHRILSNLAAVDDIDKIILSNNNPDINIEDYIKRDEYDIELINQTEHKHCIQRFEIAIKQDFEYFFCPDDDVFLSVQQMNTLIKQLKQQPEKVHGFYGQIQTFSAGEKQFGNGVCNISCEVDILNRAYLFTKQHVLKMFEYAKNLGMADISEAIYIDDLMLSFAGEGRPICHDIGEIEDCDTSHKEGIATFSMPGFDQIRLDRYAQLKKITARQ